MPAGDNPVRTAVRFPMKLAIRLQTDQGEMEAMTENSANAQSHRRQRASADRSKN
jgi:hypothetical protein